MGDEKKQSWVSSRAARVWARRSEAIGEQAAREVTLWRFYSGHFRLTRGHTVLGVRVLLSATLPRLADRCELPNSPASRQKGTNALHFLETSIVGAKVIDPHPHQDARGRFLRAWCLREFQDHGIDFVPVQANLGFSVMSGTVRGMHFQIDPAPEAKLVRCTRGAIFDVVLDLRPKSSSFGNWYGVELSAENSRMLFVPENCAHGYQTLEDNTEMHYMTSAYYTPDTVRGVRYDDPEFDIHWPLAVTAVSDQDLNWPFAVRRNP